jgi:hypothetical protein
VKGRWVVDGRKSLLKLISMGGGDLHSICMNCFDQWLCMSLHKGKHEAKVG